MAKKPKWAEIVKSSGFLVAVYDFRIFADLENMGVHPDHRADGIWMFYVTEEVLEVISRYKMEDDNYVV